MRELRVTSLGEIGVTNGEVYVLANREGLAPASFPWRSLDRTKFNPGAGWFPRARITEMRNNSCRS